MTIFNNNVANPNELLQISFDDALLSAFDVDKSTASYLIATWSLNSGVYIPFNPALETNVNELSYRSGESIFKIKEILGSTNTNSATGYKFTDSELLTIDFNGANGETLKSSEESKSSGTSTDAEVANGIKGSYSESYNEKGSKTYTEGTATTDATDDVKATITFSGGGNFKTSYEYINDTSKYSESDSSSDKVSFSYVDGLGYNMSFSLTNKSESSYAESSNDSTGAFTETSKESDKTDISKLSYSDKLGNSLKLNASIVDNVETKSDVLTESTTILLKGMSLATADYSITSKDIKLTGPSLLLAHESLSAVSTVMQNPTNVHDVFGSLKGYLNVLIQLGDNTIRVLSDSGVSVNGGDGKDTIAGKDGADTINGGLGSDIITGESGADIFVFDTVIGAIMSGTKVLDVNVDTIKDFSAGSDKLELSSSIFNMATKLDTDFISVAKLADADGGKHLIYETSSGKLFYDADGASGAAAINFVTLTGKPTLTASDIVFAADLVVI